MSPRVARRTLVVLALVIAGSMAWVAARSPGASRTSGVIPASDRRPAPELDAPSGFLNTGPLTLQQLRGRVVLVDFWTYSCINCQRTFPFLRTWHDRYASDGLVVLGVHSPEFQFERDAANVARAVAHYGITWPVALDPEMGTWNAFGNRYWPAEYVLDRQGRVAHVHFGEGDYGATERVIRTLLAEGAHGDAASAVVPAITEPPSPIRPDQTPETYTGWERGDLTSPGGYANDRLGNYRLPSHLADHGFALTGPWLAKAESITSAGPEAELVLPFRARLVHVVASGPADVIVTLDGQPVPPGQRPGAMTVRADGSTVVHVEGPDLTTVVAGDRFRSGVLRLRPDHAANALTVYSFTFGA